MTQGYRAAWPWVVGLLLIASATNAPAQYLTRTDLGVSAPQTSLRQLMAGTGFPPDKRKARLEVEREITGLREAAKTGDPDERDELAVAMIRMGQVPEGMAEMKAILAAHPGRTRTLHNLAVAQIRLGKYGDALVTLEDLDRAAPDFANGLGAGMRALAEFRRAQALKSDWSQRNLLTPELTTMWAARMADSTGSGGGDGRSKVDRHVPGIQSLVETLRRFPDFGDGWAALGVLLETRGDAYTALKCYRQAIARGTGLRPDLERHMRALEPKAQSQDPARLIGTGGLWSITVLGLAVLLFGGWRFLRAARADIHQWKSNPDNLTKKKGSHGPLGTKPLD